MKNIKRKGFTLVELLIVIVVIGILSAMMMLSSTEAVTSARASNIVSNLRNFKTAALAMYVDHLDDMDKGQLPTPASGQSTHGMLVQYMNKGGSSSTTSDNTDNYNLVITKEGGIYVYIENVSDTRVQEKLAGRAGSVGLFSDTSGTQYKSSTNNTTVYMFVTSCDTKPTSDQKTSK